jgi:exopolysaccharide production protein ExoZ
MEAKRITTLDYLRGLAATGVMTFHFNSWTYFDAIDGGTLLAKIGMFGVGMFYVLSGLTLYHVYFNKMESISDVKSFFVKRFLRIYPLLWVVMIFTAVAINKWIPDFYTSLINLTGLFGILAPHRYIGTGVWSIGNELSFYLAFPLIVLLAKKNTILFASLCGVSFLLFVYFTFFVLSPQKTLSQQWPDYVNPLNQCWYFVSGFLIGHLSKKITVKNNFALLLLSLSVMVFILLPTSGGIPNLITEWTRLVLSTMAIAIVFSFYHLAFKAPRLIDVPLKFLGECSYSIYLLHPICWFFSLLFKAALNKFLNIQIGPDVRIMVAFLGTLILSYISYHYFEKKFMKLKSQSFMYAK